MAGRIRRRRGETAPARAAADPGPQVAWSDPLPASAAPQSRRNPSPPTYLTMPPPPRLPAQSSLAAATQTPASKPREAKPATEQAASGLQPQPSASPAADALAEKGAVPGTDDIRKIRELLTQAKDRLKGIANYRAIMTRQERVGSELQPVEEVVLSVRRSPKAVRLEWPAGTNKGREVIYSEKETAGQLQVHMPNSLMPRMTLAPDSPLVMRSSRHPITEAGFDPLIGNLDRSLSPHENGTPTAARMTYGGLETPEGLTQSCHKIVENRENGETWIVYLSDDTKLPALVHATDRSGALLERYVFRDVETDLGELATASAFNPDARWGGSGGGLLSRFARSGEAKAESANPGPR